MKTATTLLALTSVALVWQSSRQPAFAVAASSNSCSHARLSSKVPGTKPWEGVLEVLREGRWGTVCINYFYFTSHNGEVACREMGFSGYEEYVSPADVSPRYGDFSDVSPVINDIRCKGMESGLLQCPNLQNVSEVSNSCSSPYYAALRCKAPEPSNASLTLVHEVREGEGLVGLQQGASGSGQVALLCDTTSEGSDALVDEVCKRMGYVEGLESRLLEKTSELDQFAGMMNHSMVQCDTVVVCNGSNDLISWSCRNISGSCNYTAIKCKVPVLEELVSSTTAIAPLPVLKSSTVIAVTSVQPVASTVIAVTSVQPVASTVIAVTSVQPVASTVIAVTSVQPVASTVIAVTSVQPVATPKSIYSSSLPSSSVKTQGSDPPLVLILSIVAAFVTLVTLFLFLLLACYCCRRPTKKRRLLSLRDKEGADSNYLTMHSASITLKRQLKRRKSAQSSILSKAPDRRDEDWEIEYSALKLTDKLGSGAFGMVYKASVSDDPEMIESTTVAVKILKDDAPESERNALLGEIEIMKEIGNHPNVVRMLGCCTKGQDIALVMEYFPHGNLKDYLVNHRPKLANGYYIFNEIDANGNCVCKESSEDESSKHLKMLDLLSFTRQIARGMEFLAYKKIIHRDLAARNILIDKYMKLKIADFGLSRDIYSDLYYKTSGGKLPIRWMAVETLTDRQYTTSSDVWSYGIVLWEIITYGEYPYPALGNSEVLDKLKEGYRMPQPKMCPDKLYELMLQCWKHSPMERPNFTEILAQLDTVISQDKEAQVYLEMM